MHTLIHLYEYYSDAAAAIAELEKAGIPHSDISIITNDQAADEKNTASSDPDVTPEATVARKTEAIGAILGGGTGLLAGLGLLAIPGIGPVLAAGWLVGLITGAGAGAVAGSLIGVLIGMGISTDHASVFAEGVRRGGALLSVRVSDDKQKLAEGIMESHDPVDPILQEKLFRQSGWTP